MIKIKAGIYQIVLIFICIFFIVPGKASNTDSLKIFDITVKETMYVQGVFCYKNFHYENDIFGITFWDDNQFKKEIYSKREFNQFYDSVMLFKIDLLDSKYDRVIEHRTSEYCNMKISINGVIIKDIEYITNLCDSTNFIFLQQWLDKKAKNISPLMDLNLLLSTNLFDFSQFRFYSMLKSISNNADRFNVNEIRTLIDTTKDSYIRKILIASLEYFKDEKILDLLAPEILQMGAINAYTTYYPMDSWLLLAPFFEQDSCKKKIDYLIQFLSSPNEIINFSSAKELLKYRKSEGVDIIFDYVDNHYWWIQEDVFIQLINYNDPIILKKMIKHYKRIKTFHDKKKNYEVIKSYILATNLLLDNKKNITKEEFINNVRGMNIGDEIIKLEGRIKRKQSHNRLAPLK